MEVSGFIEVLTAVVMVLGGQKGFEFYRRRKFMNGSPRHDMRRNSLSSRNSLSTSDKEFIQTCFQSFGLELENSRLRTSRELEGVIRDEGTSTRIAVRDRN